MTVLQATVSTKLEKNKLKFKNDILHSSGKISREQVLRLLYFSSPAVYVCFYLSGSKLNKIFSIVFGWFINAVKFK